MKRWPYLITLLFSLPIAHADVVFSGNLALSSVITKELNNRDGRAAGSNLTVKIGWLNSSTEIGLYNTNINSSVDVDHDDESVSLGFRINSNGAYIRHFKKKFYFEAGYGKASIAERVEGDLSSASLATLREIYDLSSNGEISSTEVRGLMGINLYTLSLFTLTTYIQKIKMLETSHDETNIGLELLVKI